MQSNKWLRPGMAGAPVGQIRCSATHPNPKPVALTPSNLYGSAQGNLEFFDRESARRSLAGETLSSFAVTRPSRVIERLTSKL